MFSTGGFRVAIGPRPVALPNAVSQVPFSVNNAAISAKRPSSSR